MKNRKISIKINTVKPRNPMGSVKMTGGGKHMKSQKSLRQKDKKKIAKFL